MHSNKQRRIFVIKAGSNGWARLSTRSRVLVIGVIFCAVCLFIALDGTSAVRSMLLNSKEELPFAGQAAQISQEEESAALSPFGTANWIGRSTRGEFNEGAAESTVPMSKRDPVSDSALYEPSPSTNFFYFKREVMDLAKPGHRTLSREEFKHLMEQNEKMLEDNFLTLLEYMATSEVILASYYKGAALEQEKRALQERVWAINQKWLDSGKNDPDPQMLANAEKERQIIEDANKMSSYPNGMTREEYISERISSLYE